MVDWHVDLWRPPLPLWLSIALAALATVAAFWPLLPHRSGASEPLSWPQRLSLMGLRLIALTALLLLLAGPSVVEPASRQKTPVSIIILADGSASMAQADASLPTPGGGTLNVTRWEAIARTWLDPLLQLKLRQSANVQTLVFDKDLRVLPQGHELTTAPVGRETRLIAALDAAVPAGARASDGGLIVVLSDGRDTQRGLDNQLLARLSQSGWRIWAVPVGEASQSSDMSLLAWADADRLMAGQSTWINASVTQRGLDDATATVQLFEDDQLIDTQRLALDGRPSATLRFRVTPQSPTHGTTTLYSYRLRVVPAAAEQQIENNTRQVFVQLIRQRVRVLLLEGQPHWDTRFLSRVLSGDPQVALTRVVAISRDHVLITHDAQDIASADVPGADGVTNDSPPADVATNPAELINQIDSFDIVILGKSVERFFPDDSANRLVTFVRDRGGALILARGQAFDPTTPDGTRLAAIVEPLMPVTWGSETLQQMELSLAPAGRQSPLLSTQSLNGSAGDDPQMVISQLPNMAAATRVDRHNAAAIVLLRQKSLADPQQDMAAVVYQPVGRGRVLAILTEGMWQWAFLPDSQQRFDAVYHGFWNRAIRWLALGEDFLPGAEISMALDRLAAEPDEAVTVTVHTRQIMPPDFTPRLRLTLPDGSQQQLRPQRAGQQATLFTASFSPGQVGVYQVDLIAPPGSVTQPSGTTQPTGGNVRQTLKVAVEDRNPEMQDTSANPSLLEAMATATGGRVMGLGESSALLTEITQVQALRGVTERHRYAIHQPVAIIVIFAGFFGHWILRRRWGMA